MEQNKKKSISKNLINQLYIEDKGKSQIIFEHSDKTWIMPKKHLKAAFDMYQPSTLKGKALKRIVSIFKWNEFVLGAVGCKIKKIELDSTLQEKINEVLKTSQYHIATYMGDTSSKQNNKATLQIYDDSHIIAYAKVTKDEDVANTFTHEVEALKYLEEKEIRNVPKVLGTGCVDGIEFFIQSTDKPLHQKVKLKFGTKQIDFIDKIVQSTKEKLTYEETDFYNYVQYLKGRLDDFSDEEKSALKKAIEKVEEKLTDKPQEYAFFHGDFTPWNVCYNNGEMHAFDFEYCSYTMPCYMDVFHYLTQMCFLGFNEGVGKAIHIYKNAHKVLEQYICDTDFTYLCYLVWVVSFYKKRTESEADISRKYNQWIELMEYFNSKVE